MLLSLATEAGAACIACLLRSECAAFARQMRKRCIKPFNEMGFLLKKKDEKEKASSGWRLNRGLSYSLGSHRAITLSMRDISSWIPIEIMTRINTSQPDGEWNKNTEQIAHGFFCSIDRREAIHSQVERGSLAH